MLSKRNIVIAIVAVVLACCAIGTLTNHNSTKTTASTANTTSKNAATATYKTSATLTTLLSLSGTGQKNSTTFTVKADQWSIVWTCAPSDQFSGNLSVTVKGADGTYKDLAVNEICSTKKGDSTIERGAGAYYLEITADVTWSIQVQAIQ